MAKPPPKILVRTYKGRQAAASRAFEREARKLAAQGYWPTAQTWAPGAYGAGNFLLALILCVVVIGIVIFIYMLLVKPPGTLTVTYQRRAPTSTVTATDEKLCPQCAESVKAAAKVCRFCGHRFDG